MLGAKWDEVDADSGIHVRPQAGPRLITLRVRRAWGVVQAVFPDSVGMGLHHPGVKVGVSVASGHRSQHGQRFNELDVTGVAVVAAGSLRAGFLRIPR